MTVVHGEVSKTGHTYLISPCIDCGFERLVRKDRVGGRCRKCSAKIVAAPKKRLGPYKTKCLVCGCDVVRNTKAKPRRSILCRRCITDKAREVANLKRTGYGPLCTVDGCGDPSFRHGMCQSHIAQKSLAFTLGSISSEKLADFRNAYMAGIVDGEGTITIYRCNEKRKSEAVRYRTILSVYNTDVRLMEWIDRNFGERSLSVKRHRGGNSKDCYNWTATNIKAAEVAKMVLPFLVIKKRQAELLIEFMTTASRFLGTRHIDPKIALRREEITKEINLLNRKGKHDAVVGKISSTSLEIGKNTETA